MSSFRIFETDQFLEDLDREFSGQKERIKGKLDSYAYPQLKEQPYFGKNIKKLKNYKPETWRYRIGGHRFFYGMEFQKEIPTTENRLKVIAERFSCEIDDHKRIIFMISADNRADAY